MIPLWAQSGGMGTSPIFSLDNITTIVPESSGGSSTPTYTRASTAYQTDFEAKLNLCLSGEVRFQGARRVRNQYTGNTDTLAGFSTTGTCTNVGTASIAGPDGSTVTVRELSWGATATSLFYVTGPDLGAAGSRVVTFWIRAKTASTTCRLVASNIGQVVSVTTTWQRLSAIETGAGTTSGLQNNAGGNSGDMYVYQALSENVTGQTNQNPSEYVSVGVLSAPYHGAGVDGVKYFATLNGNTVASNVVTEATGAQIAQGASGVSTSAPVSSTRPFGYLPEPAATNVLLQSQTLGTTWTVSNAADMNAVTADQYVAPDGTTTMDQLKPKNTTAVHSLDQAFTFTAATYTCSGYLRYVSATPQRWVALVLNDGTTTWAASFDLLNGTAGAVSNCTSTISPTGLANVYRVTITKSAAAAAAAGTVKISLNATDTASLESALRAGTETLGAWGFQLETGSVATSYIPTTTGSVQRLADVDQYVSASNLSSTTETIALTWFPQSASITNGWLWGTYVDANNYTAIFYDGTNVRVRKRIAGVNTDATKTLTIVAGTGYRIVGRLDTVNGIDVWVDGVKGTGSATLTASQIGTNFQMGADGNSLQQANGSIQLVASYNRLMSDAQAAAL